jgi:hypothetical protein
MAKATAPLDKLLLYEKLVPASPQRRKSHSAPPYQEPAHPAYARPRVMTCVEHLRLRGYFFAFFFHFAQRAL